MSQPILTINAGSSSIKFAAFQMPDERRIASGMIDRIGLAGGRFQASGSVDSVDRSVDFPDHDAALEAIFEWLRQLGNPRAIGHRVVQGGPRLIRPTPVTPETVAELKTFIPLAPNHLPGEIAAIEAASRTFPTLPQILCFDTAFHRAMPPLHQRFPLPREYYDQGILRFGFHGLSYQYIVEELGRISKTEHDGRVVIAHLGNGASLAAVSAGIADDTTMGLTPLGGLVMSTRAGDLDPGVVLHLIRGGMSVDQVEELLAKKSGLLGTAGSSDMRDLLARQATDPHAADAVEMFCRQTRKFIAAMAASLGGIDSLIFTGGIGEHSPEIRGRIVRGLGFLGMVVDDLRNEASAEVISSDRSQVMVRVMKTNEELMIARQTWGQTA